MSVAGKENGRSVELAQRVVSVDADSSVECGERVVGTLQRVLNLSTMQRELKQEARPMLR